MAQSSDRLVVTLGKLSVVDIFDANRYAHDPQSDFLNWSLIDAGTFDYAARLGLLGGRRARVVPGALDLARRGVRSFGRSQQPAARAGNRGPVSIFAVRVHADF